MELFQNLPKILQVQQINQAVSWSCRLQDQTALLLAPYDLNIFVVYLSELSMGFINFNQMDKRSLAFNFFGLYYFGFGIASFFPSALAPFFISDPTTWDPIHVFFLAFSGVFAIHVGIWSFVISKYAPYKSFCITQAFLLFCTFGVLVYNQTKLHIFSSKGLICLGVDFLWAFLFLHLGLKDDKRNKIY
jgi:hypothetical protein